ncbi:hypothetical protein UPYG_G00243370 [Umbra pygmaea]|uniref:Ig-like domain-containing protein n=1 Tax=Umbra pygmaea TaxID=75934 RepID=A0ABD0WKT8_UMBPY
MEHTCVALMMFSTMVNSGPGTGNATLSIRPDRSQFFEYESVSLRCEVQGSSTGWRLKRYTATGKHFDSDINYEIHTAKTSDSGEYWCESGSGVQSKAVNITVHDGSVILKSPALPVPKGRSVTLRCKHKTPLSDLTADFYRDGSIIGRDLKGELTIPAVSGLYKCIVPLKGESPASKMAATESAATTLIVRPEGSDFFEYESMTLSCEVQGSSTGWRLKRYKTTGTISDSVVDRGFNPGPKYIVATSKTSDSGVYRCESDSGEHSNVVNITVHGGSVILESPALPVTEGHSVTLRCRYQTTPSNLTADFYKDGSLIRTQSTGEMTIPIVNKSDEGQYWCRHHKLGRSPDRRMTVTGSTPSPSIPVLSMSLSRLLCSLLVVTPYLMVTIVLLVKMCIQGNRRRKQGSCCK